MHNPIDNLSAKELFELAKKKLRKEQEEARRAERDARAREERKRRRELLRANHQQALATIDKEIAALAERREQLIRAFEADLARLEQEMGALKAPCLPTAASTVSGLLTAAPALVEPQKGNTDDTLEDAILEIMRGRMDISDSLIREKLRAAGYGLTHFNKQMDKLVREGKIVSRGLGNYGLKRKI